MRFIGTLVVFGTIALLWKGGQGVYEAVGNAEPAELSCAELENTPPASGWFRLTGCVANLLDASYRKPGSEVTELFIPAYPAGDEKPDKIHLVVATEDPELKAFMEEMASVDESGGTGAALQVLAKHADKLRVTRNFQGMVQAGIDKSDKVRKKLAGLQGNLAADFVILEEGREPALGVSTAMLAAGVLLAGFLGFGMVKRRGKGGEPGKPGAPESDPETPQGAA